MDLILLIYFIVDKIRLSAHMYIPILFFVYFYFIYSAVVYLNPDFYSFRIQTATNRCMVQITVPFLRGNKIASFYKKSLFYKGNKKRLFL